MPHPADPALKVAVGEVIRRLRTAGMSTRQIADHFGVSDPTVNRWENGERVPALDQLPELDALSRAPRGHVLRLAGYVQDEPIDIVAAIRNDPSIPDHLDREALLLLYSTLRTRRAD